LKPTEKIVLFIKHAKLYSETRKKWRSIKLPAGSGKNEATLSQKFKNYWKNPYGVPAKELAVLTSLTGKEDYRFVPELYYYLYIEPRLNNRNYAFAYADKNIYHTMFPERKKLFPKAILRYINGSFYNQDYSEVRENYHYYTEPYDVFIVKASTETGGGRDVVKVVRSGTEYKVGDSAVEYSGLFSHLGKLFRGSYQIQELIQQLDWYSSFNPTSVNTIRMFTYRSPVSDQVHILQSVLRFGRKGSFVDNQASGGFTCGITSDGFIRKEFCTKYGLKKPLTELGVKIIDEKVPGLESMKETAKQLAPRFFYHRLLGFDFCVDTSGNVRLLEVNTKNIEINFMQMNNGPLFGDLTDEVLEVCKQRKSIWNISISA